MLKYVQYTVPNAEAQREQIYRVKGERAISLFADDIKRSSPHVKIDYEEFCEHLNKTIFTAYCKDADNNLIKISGEYKSNEELEKQL